MPGPADSSRPGRRTQLNRALSKLGICSRTEGERRIAAGEVKVNGKVVKDPDHWVELGRDLIETPETGLPSKPGPRAGPQARPVALPGGQPALDSGSAQADHRYFRMHKPAGYVTTRSDELGRETVYDLLPPEARTAWIFPVGRLDRDSEGLLLLTDDGAWSDRLTDPAFHVAKRYRVKLDGRPREDELDIFRAGVILKDRKSLPAEVEPEGGSWYLVTLREGRNRQIRRMFHGLGYKVKRLIRISIGPLELGDLAPGEVKPLEKKWVEALASAGSG